MTTGIENWTLKDWLESAAYAVAILGAVVSGIIFLANSRREAIESTSKEIIRSWTNEGDISSRESLFVDLQLENHDGDIIGTLQSSKTNHLLDVHANVGWRSTELTVIKISGRSVNRVATAYIKLTGNNNRLQWQISGDAPDYLPRSTELWPNQVKPPSSD